MDTTTNNQPTTTSNFMDTITNSIPNSTSESSSLPLESDVSESIFSKPSTWIVMIIVFIGIISLGVFYFMQTPDFEKLLKKGKDLYNQIMSELEEDEEDKKKDKSDSSKVSVPVPTKLPEYTKQKNNKRHIHMYGATGATGATGHHSKYDNLYRALEHASHNHDDDKPVENWCYVGSDDYGTRYCSSVDKSDNCMSGNIYPSRRLCINPNLRV